MKILGIDPGSRLTGYGCIEKKGNQLKHIAHGTLHLITSKDPIAKNFEERLYQLFQQLSAVIVELKPQVMAVEKIFFAKNALSALKLGHARGVILLTAKVYGLEIAEYNPTEVKRACVGHGQADKEQVAKMIQLILGQREFQTADASDALALAVCHAQMGNSYRKEALKSVGRSVRQSIGEPIEKLNANLRTRDIK